MRLRFALAAALPAFAGLLVMALVADRLARRALEDELGARLTAVAQAAAASLPADRVEWLRPGDEATRTFAHVRSRLESLANATGTRLYLLRPDRSALADSGGALPIGAAVPGLERDRFEIGEAAKGRALPSQVLFAGTDGRLYKSGYAPLSDSSGKVVAVVGADGTAPSFAALSRFRRLLGLVALGGAVLGAGVAGAAAVSVTRPLRSLAAAARRIGGGDLRTPLEPGAGPREVATLRTTLEDMRGALAARDDERATLLAGIAHEVRNPLGAIELFAGMLAEDVRGRPEAAHVQRIQAEVARLGRITETFLDYARPRHVEVEEVDAAALVAEAADLAQPLAQQRGVRLEMLGDGRLCADREALGRAVLNLVRNAVEASPAGAAVEVEAHGRGDGGVVEVRDCGPGLDGDARERAFQPFFTTKENGTGLGLALARKVALAHGGAIVLLPRDGGGTLARITLPPPRGATPPTA
ncbi:MAG TPA: HAMP domain-containing sensor histidine kinase [Anaeromyxobacteraceae bacterium]|nr:HAMP domain-containing sensor histidine kinase [Anaeromyxobacteraceae bacterium]